MGNNGVPSDTGFDPSAVASFPRGLPVSGPGGEAGNPFAAAADNPLTPQIQNRLHANLAQSSRSGVNEVCNNFIVC